MGDRRLRLRRPELLTFDFDVEVALLRDDEEVMVEVVLAFRKFGPQAFRD